MREKADDRRILRDLNVPWLLGVQRECRNEDTCRALRIGDDTYMCRVHSDGRLCTAREYICHTIDAATEQLQVPRHPTLAMPLHLHPCMQLYTSVCKQLARIFSHIYLHHHDLFARCEQTTHLYARFHELTEMYDLLPEITPIPN